MSTSPFFKFGDIQVKEVAPGFFSRLIHTEVNTINFIEVEAGRAVPLHRHDHEQYTFVIQGKFEFTIDGDTRVLEPEDYALIPSNALHGGHAVTDCKLLDIFWPVREDYRAL